MFNASSAGRNNDKNLAFFQLDCGVGFFMIGQIDVNGQAAGNSREPPHCHIQYMYAA